MTDWSFNTEVCSVFLGKRLAHQFNTSYKQESHKGKDYSTRVVHVHQFRRDEFKRLGSKTGELGFLDGLHVAPRPDLDKGTDDETCHEEQCLLVELAQQPVQEFGEGYDARGGTDSEYRYDG